MLKWGHYDKTLLINTFAIVFKVAHVRHGGRTVIWFRQLFWEVQYPTIEFERGLNTM